MKLYQFNVMNTFLTAWSRICVRSKITRRDSFSYKAVGKWLQCLLPSTVLKYQSIMTNICISIWSHLFEDARLLHSPPGITPRPSSILPLPASSLTPSPVYCFSIHQECFIHSPMRGTFTELQLPSVQCSVSELCKSSKLRGKRGWWEGWSEWRE